MNHTRAQAFSWGAATRWISLLCLLGGVVTGLVVSGHAQAQDAPALKARHAELQARLANNHFGRPVYLQSAQTADDLKGDIYSVVEYPYAAVQQALQPVDHW